MKCNFLKTLLKSTLLVRNKFEKYFCIYFPMNNEIKLQWKKKVQNYYLTSSRFLINLREINDNAVYI